MTSICSLVGILVTTAVAAEHLTLNTRNELETMKEQPALSCREQCLVAISARAAAGDLPGLERELAAGLDAGLGVEEIKEALVQLYAYCGFPRSLNALGVLMSVVRERATRGVQDADGPQASPIQSGSSVEVGGANQERLCGAPVTGELFAFAPAIDAFLKAHLFGDIFGRDNLD